MTGPGLNSTISSLYIPTNLASSDATILASDFANFCFVPGNEVPFVLDVSFQSTSIVVNKHRMTTKSKSVICKLKNFVFTMSSIGAFSEPRNYKEALKVHNYDHNASPVSIVCKGNMDLEKANIWLGTLLIEQSEDIYRMKGLLSVQGMDKRCVIEVFMTYSKVHLIGCGKQWNQDCIHREEFRQTRI